MVFSVVAYSSFVGPFRQCHQTLAEHIKSISIQRHYKHFSYLLYSSPSLLSFSDTQTQTNNGMLWVVLMFSTELEMKSFTSNRATKISRHGCFGGTMLTSMNPTERGTNSSIQLLLVASPCHSASQLPESKRDELQLQLIPI